jgi:predicted metal-binding protein
MEEQKNILKAQIQILLKLNNRIEEGEDFYEAWIELKKELLRKLRKLEAC